MTEISQDERVIKHPAALAEEAKNLVTEAEDGGEDGMDKYLRAGRLYQLAYDRFSPERQAIERIACAESAVRCLGLTDSFEELARFGHRVLKRHVNDFPTIQRRFEFCQSVWNAKDRTGLQDLT